MDTIDWTEQLQHVEGEIADANRQIEEVLSSIKPIQERKQRLEDVRNAIKALIGHESGKSETSSEPRIMKLRDLFTIGSSVPRARSVNSSRQVMLNALKAAGRPMSPQELWTVAADAGYTTKQKPEDAANYSMYGAKSKYNDPIERLATGEWVWIGS